MNPIMKKNNNVLLAHGGGGKLTRQLLYDHFLSKFKNKELHRVDDSAVVAIGNRQVAFTTDTFVVKPLFYPGGNIGHLAVCGTVNDLAVTGAKPMFLSAGFVIEEGFPLSSLDEIISSMQKTAEVAGVEIITGDTKVVEKGSCDGIFINTAGIGVIDKGLMSNENFKPGDKIIINGPLGDHGIAVVSARGDLPMDVDIKSDNAPLNLLITPLLEKFPGKVKFMRDATRGGFATVLNEIIEDAGLGISIFEDKIPVREPVKAVCELLGFDPLYLANEGKVVTVVPAEPAENVLTFMKKQPHGAESAIVGEFTEQRPGRVILKTGIGGGRILDMMIGDQLPRIC